jgi:hypothetical protein
VARTLIYEQHNGRLEWQNEAQDILVFTLTDLFTWDEAISFMERLNAVIADRAPASVDTIYYFEQRDFPLPSQGMLSNLVRIMQMTVPNERLIVIVNNVTLRGVIQAAAVAYDLMSITNKYRYTESLENAVAMIKIYRQSLPEIT